MPDHDPEVTPEQEARLRRLLSGARHAEPVPDDAAARHDRVHEQLAYVELSGIVAMQAGALPGLRLLLCVAGEQEVLAGMLNAVALATCLRTPETVAPDFCLPSEGASLLSLHACIEHYAAALGLDAGEAHEEQGDPRAAAA